MIPSKLKDWRKSHPKGERLLRKGIRPLLAALLLMVLITNVFGSSLVTSVSNQEFFSYHIKDLINKLSGRSTGAAAGNLEEVFTDPYEQEKDGPLFGVAKGRNLIVVQMESFQNFVIGAEYNGQELTPNFNELIKDQDTIYFDNYYQQVGSGNTSDAEFATNNSIFGSIMSYTYGIYYRNYFHGLPFLLKELGYGTQVYHGYDPRFWNRETAYPHMGFDRFISRDDFEQTETIGMGLSDEEFFRQSVEDMAGIEQPFYSFLITLSNHYPYYIPEEYYEIELLPEDRETTFGNYINSVHYADQAIGSLIRQLKQNGLYDNSIIAFYGDHMGLTKEDDQIAASMTGYLGKEYDYQNMINIPLIITVPDAESKEALNRTVTISGGQLDFLPTIAYLMGFEQLDTIYLGHNLLTIDSGFVAEQCYMPKGSFIRDDILFEMSADGVFRHGRAWNRVTGDELPVAGCYDDYLRSLAIINTSESILKNDSLREWYGGGTRKPGRQEEIPMTGPGTEGEEAPELAPGLVTDGPRKEGPSREKEPENLPDEDQETDRGGTPVLTPEGGPISRPPEESGTDAGGDRRPSPDADGGLPEGLGPSREPAPELEPEAGTSTESETGTGAESETGTGSERDSEAVPGEEESHGEAMGQEPVGGSQETDQ